MLYLNITLNKNHPCFLWPYWEKKNLNLKIWEMGQKSQPWRSSCLKAAGSGDSRVCLVEDLEQWPCHPSFIHCLEILPWWFKSELHRSELFDKRGLSAGSQQISEERLEKPEFYLAKTLFLKSIFCLFIIKMWGRFTPQCQRLSWSWGRFPLTFPCNSELTPSLNGGAELGKHCWGSGEKNVFLSSPNTPGNTKHWGQWALELRRLGWDRDWTELRE